LKDRQGHTEASVQLAMMAGTKPVAIICEIMNADGSMSRIPDLEPYAEKWSLNMISIDEVIEYCNEIGWEPPIQVG
jgi:3,4-dihydroxy 2-butanone 4-phosphate synthase/GTP cyclohydrolase II